VRVQGPVAVGPRAAWWWRGGAGPDGVAPGAVTRREGQPWWPSLRPSHETPWTPASSGLHRPTADSPRQALGGRRRRRPL